MLYSDCTNISPIKKNFSGSYNSNESIDPSDMVSANEMANRAIESYHTGYEKGYNEGHCDGEAKLLSKIKEKLQTDFQYIGEISNEFIKDINTEKSVFKSAFVRFTPPCNFHLLYAMDKTIYFDDDISRPIYKKSWELSKTSTNVGRNLKILFIPYSESININSIIADGYFHMYRAKE